MAHAFPQSGYTPPVAPDPRNFDLAMTQAPKPFPATYKTDISALPVFDQAKIPDCVQNAICLLKMYHDFKSSNKLEILARRFLAIETVKVDGFPLSNGTNIENSLWVSKNKGVCINTFLNDNHEIDIEIFENPMSITGAAYGNALDHKTFSYAFVKDKSINGLKNAIFQNGLVLVGGRIDDNWWTAPNGQVSWDKRDIYPIRPPESNSDTKSNHAFVLYGYDEGGFFLRNSFGVEWADQGTNYIPNSAMGIIYEAATLVDLDPAQIAAIRDMQKDIEAVNIVIHNFDPKSPAAPTIMALLVQVGGLIAKMFKEIFTKK